jgi:hypothetical protein
MNAVRAITVHVLAGSLLLAGFLPCRSQLSLGASAGCHATAASVSRAVPLSHDSPASHAGPCCCGETCPGGNSASESCCCRSQEAPATPTAPSNPRSETQEQVAAVTWNLPALGSQCDAVSLLRAAALAGNGLLPIATLQTQSVRIQT